MEKKKKIIGLLGGIGSGKSTAATELKKLGCGIIDADKIVHELLEKDEIIKQLADAFGETILTQDGRVDKVSLANIAFDSQKNLNKLNSIIHPDVFIKIRALIEHFNNSSQVKAIVLDVPLLLETGNQIPTDIMIFVDCNDRVRVERALKKGLFNKKHLKKRENFQISLDKKAKIADYILDNNSGLEALAEQIARIFTNITDYIK
ncbi:MAG: dephospho-CoA kinase [Sedimentisphaerales bacterium]|nr:dephospho-CoA kinase [Sedimentisphaerales bacterium]